MFKMLNSCFLLKIQTWLNKNDHLNISFRHVSLLKSEQVLSKHFSTGQESLLWKSCTHHWKAILGWGTGTNQQWWTMIRSCHRCFINKSSSTKSMSAKGSLILALLSMKWDWKMVLNGLLNWRNDVLWSFTPKPPLETGIVSVKSSPKTQVLSMEPKPFKP